MADKVLASALSGKEHLEVFDEMAAERFAELELEAVLVYLIDIVKATALPALGSQLDVMGFKGWLLATTEAERRALIKNAIELHRYKGTPWAVKEAIKRFGFDLVSVLENVTDDYWQLTGAVQLDGSHLLGGNYHWAYFRVIIDINGIATDITTTQSDTLIRLINEYKNVRSWLRDLSFSVALEDTAPATEEFALEAELALEDDVATQLLLDGSWQLDGSNQLDFDFLDITIIDMTVPGTLFDYDFDFTIQ